MWKKRYQRKTKYSSRWSRSLCVSWIFIDNFVRAPFLRENLAWFFSEKDDLITQKLEHIIHLMIPSYIYDDEKLIKMLANIAYLYELKQTLDCSSQLPFTAISYDSSFLVRVTKTLTCRFEVMKWTKISKNMKCKVSDYFQSSSVFYWPSNEKQETSADQIEAHYCICNCSLSILSLIPAHDCSRSINSTLIITRRAQFNYLEVCFRFCTISADFQSSITQSRENLVSFFTRTKNSISDITDGYFDKWMKSKGLRERETFLLT